MLLCGLLSIACYASQTTHLAEIQKYIVSLQNDLKEAQLARDEVKVSILRFLLAQISNAKIAKGSDLTDEDIISEVSKEIKRHKESIEAFKKGNREL